MSNKEKCFVGIDTSNYTTSFALCAENGEIKANIKKMLSVKDGERGLRQSDAVFSHIKNIPDIANEIREATKDVEIEAIGVSSKPRDAESSYMPCFTVGVAVAEILAATLGVPLYCFSHQSGHIMAALYSSGELEELIKDKFIAFHLSGGTTEALLVTPNDDTFDVELIAETADINAGQAIDRAGVMMGMSFPCGKEIERYASEFVGKLPKPKTTVKNGRCNLSGLENIAEKLYKETNDISLVSAYVLDFVGETVEKMTEFVRETYGELPIVYAGGVMSNKILKNRLSKFKDTYFSAPEFSSDNGAGIALLTRRKHQR